MKKINPLYAAGGAVLAVSMGWTVMAAGDLLTGVAPTWAAYAAGGLFEASWLGAQYASYRHGRQGSPSKAADVLGWIFLAATVAVLIGHGLLKGDAFAAVAGGLVPVIAKGLLLLAAGVGAGRIGDDAQELIDRERADHRDRLAVGRVRHGIQTSQAKATDDWYADLVDQQADRIQADAEHQVTLRQATAAAQQRQDALKLPVDVARTELPARPVLPVLGDFTPVADRPALPVTFADQVTVIGDVTVTDVDDVVAVADAVHAAPAFGFGRSLASVPAPVNLAAQDVNAQDVNAQVSTSSARRAQDAALASVNGPRKTERQQRVDVVRTEGLTVADIMARWSVSLRTAQQYLADAGKAS